jgi:hypothetical protein
VLQLAGSYAKLNKVDKGFWYQMAEGLGRGVEGFTESVPRAISEQVARADLRMMDKGVPLFRVQGPGGRETLAEVGDTPNVTPLTAQEVADERAKLEKRLRVFKVQRELRNLAETEIDPIKTVTFLPSIVEEGLYGFSQSAAYSAVAAIPFLGLPAVTAAIYAQNYDGIMLDHPDIDPDKAALVALCSAVIEGPLERMQVNVIFGKLPIFGKLVKRWTNGKQRFLVRFLLGGVGVSAEENTQETIQNLCFPVAQTIAAALDEDMPGYDWRKAIEGAPRAAAVQFVTLLPLSILGMGGIYSREIKRGQDYLKSSEAMGMMGATTEQIDRVMAQESTEARETVWREVYSEISAEKKAAGAEKVVTELVNKAVELRQQTAPATLPRLEKQGADYTIVAADGEVIHRTTDQDSAELLHGIAKREAIQKEMAQTTAGITETVSYLTKVNEARQRGEDVQQIQAVAGKVNAFDEFSANPTNFAALKSAVTAATGDEITEPEQLRAYWLDASNSGALRDGVYRSVIKLFDGADGTKLVRDFAQDNLKRAVAEGRVDMAWVRDQLNQTIPLVQGSNAEVQLSTATDNDVIESFSDIALAYLYGRVKHDQIAPGLRGFLVRMARVVRDIFRRAYNLEKARVAGQLAPEWQALLAESVGIDQQGVVDAARQTASEGRGVDGLTDEERAALVAEMAADAEAEARENAGDGGIEAASLAEVFDSLHYSVRAHHGTPHKINKAFSLDKIGAGEGAQVYGWGLYFADNEKVAQTYRNMAFGDAKDARDMAAAALRDYKDPTQAVRGLRNGDFGNASLAPEIREQAASLIDSGDRPTLGNLYTVDIDVEPEDLLDWDKPLSEQSEKVRAAIKDFLENAVNRETDYHRASAMTREFSAASFMDKVGRDIYETAKDVVARSDNKGVPARASEALAAAGIPGIRYLDQGSRTAAPARKLLGNWLDEESPKPTYNYVIFDDSKIKITEENGQPVAAVDATEGARTSNYSVSKASVKNRKDLAAMVATVDGVVFSKTNVTNRHAEEVMRAVVNAIKPNSAAAFRNVMEFWGGWDRAQWPEWAEQQWQALRDHEDAQTDTDKHKDAAGENFLNQRGVAMEDIRDTLPWDTQAVLLGFDRFQRIPISGRNVIYRGETQPPDVAAIEQAPFSGASNVSRSEYPRLLVTLSNGGEFYQTVRVSDHDQVSSKSPREYEYDYRAKSWDAAQSAIEQDMQELADNIWRKQREILEKNAPGISAEGAGIKTGNQAQADKSGLADWQPEGGSALTRSDKATASDKSKSFSISSQAQLDRVNAALSGLNRGPEGRAAIYERAREKFAKMQQDNWGFLYGLEAGGAKAADIRRTKALQAMGELDAILSVLPPEVRGKVGGFTTLANIGTGDKALADFFIKRISMIDKEVERMLKREYLAAIDDLVKKARPKRGESGVAKSTLGDRQEMAEMVYRATLMDSDATARKLLEIEGAIENAEDPSALSEQWLLVNTFGDLENRTAEELAQGFAWLKDQFKKGREMWRIQEDARIAEQRAKQEAVVAFLGEGTARQRWTEKGLWTRLADAGNHALLDHASFAQLVRAVFPPEIANEMADRMQQLDTASQIYENGERKAILDALRAAAKSANISTAKALRQLKTAVPKSVSYLEGRRVKNEEIAIELAEKIIKGTASPGALSRGDIKQLEAELVAIPLSSRREKVVVKRVIAQGKPVMLDMTPAKAMQLLLSWNQPDVQDKMRREGWTDDSIADMEKITADPISQAMLAKARELYAKGADLLNPVSVRMFGMKIPQVKNYAPSRFLHSKDTKEVGIDGMIASSGSTPSFMKGRVTHSAKIAPADALDVMQQHILQQSHWVHFAELGREFRAIIGNPQVQEAIRQAHGDGAISVLTAWADQLQQRGGKRAREQAWISNLVGSFIGGNAIASLGLNLKTISMQLENAIRFALSLNTRQIVGALSNPQGVIADIPKVWASDAIRVRLEGGATAEARFLFSRYGGKGTAAAKIADMTMQPINYFDSAAMALSSAVVYRSAKNDAIKAGMPEAFAEKAGLDAAEKAIYEFAQPVSFGQKSNIENSGNILTKAFFVFMSDPRWKASVMAESIRGLATGQGDRSVHIRRLVAIEMLALVSHVIASAYRDAFTDDDDEDIWSIGGFAKALLMAPLQGYFLVGAAIDVAASRLLGQPQFSSTNNPLGKWAETALRAGNNLGDISNFDDPDAMLKEWASLMRVFAVSPAAAFPAAVLNLLKPVIGLSENMGSED